MLYKEYIRIVFPYSLLATKTSRFEVADNGEPIGKQMGNEMETGPCKENCKRSDNGRPLGQRNISIMKELWSLFGDCGKYRTQTMTAQSTGPPGQPDSNHYLA